MTEYEAQVVWEFFPLASALEGPLGPLLERGSSNGVAVDQSVLASVLLDHQLKLPIAQSGAVLAGVEDVQLAAELRVREREQRQRLLTSGQITSALV